jgi:predicted transcriptional regulator
MPTKVYRGRYEIIAQILSTINDGSINDVARTSIMFTAFLSHAQPKEYLSFMVEKVFCECCGMRLRGSPLGIEPF